MAAKAEKKGNLPAVPRVEEPWEIALREKAKKARAAETLGVPRITHKSGLLRIGKDKLDKNRVRIVPLGLVYSKQYYLEAYEDGSTSTPDCYAFGQESDKGLVPHAAAPHKQSPTCDECPHNVFGSAERGRGKACSDRRVLLFLLADDLANESIPMEKRIAKAAHMQISIPPGSLKNFGKYLDSLTDLTPHGAIEEAITEISAEPAEKAYVLTFEFCEVVPKEAMGPLMARGEKTWGLLNQPFPVIKQEEEKDNKRPLKGQGKGR